MPIVLGILHSQRSLNPYNLNDLDLPTYFSSQQYVDNQISLQIHAQTNERNSGFMVNENSGMVIVADATIFNRKEILKKLSCEISSTITDAEIILQAYKIWGIACLQHLNGNFCFAIWDSKNQQLFLASDPVGSRSLFYGISPDGSFCFANFTKPLFEICHFPRTLNPQKIGDYLTMTHVSHEQTYFQHIQRLPAGHYLHLNDLYLNARNPSYQPTCYWSAADIAATPFSPAKPEDFYLQFRELFEVVIQERLIAANYHVGCHLSGGLDSSSVAAMSASLFSQQKLTLNTFGYVPTSRKIKNPRPNWNYNDREMMQAVPNQYKNVKLNLIEDDTKKLFEYCDALHPWLDIPPLNPSNMLWITVILEQAQKLNLTSILTGGSGNFTISWTGKALPPTNLLALRRIKRQLASYKKIFIKWQNGYNSHQPWGNYACVSPQLAKKINLRERYETYNFIHNPELFDDQRIYAFDNGSIALGSTLHSALQLIYGINIWDPTIDKRIVEFCLRLPNEIFWQNKRSRLLVREGLKDILPTMILKRTTRGMQAADWYKKIERQKNEIINLLQSWKTTVVEDYIDVKQLLRLMQKWNYERVAASCNQEYSDYEYQYNMKLLRAIETGLFIQSNS